MQGLQLHTRRRRAQGAIGLVCVLLGGLSFAFFRTQVLSEPEYATQSERNRLRPVAVPPSRGVILDRDGRSLAETVPGHSLSLLPAPASSVRRALTELAPLIELSPARVEALLDRASRDSGRPLLVAANVSPGRLEAIEANRHRFPEILIEPRPKRHYPLGAAAAHLIGYVGEISDDELRDPTFSGYRAGRTVGKAGVEREHERRLSGQPGMRFVEVDAIGRLIGRPAGREVVPAMPGDSLRLTVDGELQQWIAGLVGDTARGAVVAVEPATGAVLALYSSPSPDPNTLVEGFSPDQWRSLRRDPGKPLLNRAIGAGYSPGATWKPATAAIALRLGILDPEAQLPLACRGGMPYGTRYFRCWNAVGHGQLNLADAVKHSCDVYFYQLGLQIGLERLLAEGTRLGFGARTGVDLPGERSGLFPSAAEWYTRRFGASPNEEEVLRLSIGGGPNDQTALRMAQFYAAVAMDGRIAAPTLVDAAPPADTLEIGIAARDLVPLREGLRRVTADGGPGSASRLERWSWIGAMSMPDDPAGSDHGWFVGIGGRRDDAPEVVVAAVMEGRGGASAAARIAARTAEYYLARRYEKRTDGVPPVPEQAFTARAAPAGTR